MTLAEWLRGLELSEYEETFRANGIDVRVLPTLSEGDLEKLGVLLGHRRRMLRAIADIEPERGPPVQAADDGRGIAPGSETARRRQLTVMFCDLVGSTALSVRLDPEDFREVMTAFHRSVSQILRKFDGFIARYMGDGVLVYFGYPQAHEQEAEHALNAALELVENVPLIRVDEDPLQIRIGIATGMVVVGDLIGEGASKEFEVVGPTPNLAARLQAMAEPNSILVSPTTRHLVGNLFEWEPLGLVDLRGFASPVQVWRLLRAGNVESRFHALRASSKSPLIGREAEIDLLLKRWEGVKAGRGSVLLLSGEPGIGKSRIAAEMGERLAADPHRHLQLFCSPHHRDSPLYPLIKHLERVSTIAREDLPAVKFAKLKGILRGSDESTAEAAELFGALLDLPDARPSSSRARDPQRQREMTLDAFSRQLERLADEAPALIVFEDAQWADATSLELLEGIVAMTERLRVMLLVTCRPEFAPAWADRAHVVSLDLSRLTADQSAVLAEQVAGNKPLPKEILSRIVGSTDGVPLFVEELSKMLLEGDLLREEASAYVLAKPLPPLAIPSSLHASLLARLDRLGDVKQVAQIGAVLGREFPADVLAAVAELPDGELRHALEQLVQAGLILRRSEPARSSFVFKHLLIRDAAYSTLLRGERQDLHSRVALVMAERFPDLVDSQPEILAHHYTAAGQVEPAIRTWRDAGERAVRRFANIEAMAHLTHGIELLSLLPAGRARDRLEFNLYVALGPAVRGVKGHSALETHQVFSRARALLDERGTVMDQMTVLYGRYGVSFVRAENGPALEVAQQCLELASRHNLAEPLTLAHRLLGEMRWVTGSFTQARSHLEQSLDFNSVEHDRSLDMQTFAHDNNVSGLVFLAVTLCPLGYLDQAAATGGRALAMAREIGHPATLGLALFGDLVRANFLNAEPGTVVEMAQEVTQYCADHGVPLHAQWAKFYLGANLARLGQTERGIETMRTAMTGLERSNIGLFHTVHLGHLATAYQSVGEPHTALALLNEALDTVASTEERLFEAELHRLRGELRLQMGEEDEGTTDLLTAIFVAQRQKARLWELRAASSLTQHRCAGSDEEPQARLAPVYEWFTEGLDSPDLTRARSLLGR